MAHIKQHKEGLELDITPAARWYEDGQTEPCVEYEVGFYYKDEPLFSDVFAERFLALKDEQAPYLSSFILQVLATGQADNWIMLTPNVSIFMGPKDMLGCGCRGEMPDQTLFIMEIKLDQNIMADKPYAAFSDTGLTLRLEAPRGRWGEFARQLEQEEIDFED